MSAATAEPPVEEIVQTPRAARLFAARRSGLQLTKVGVIAQRDAEGRQVDLKPGQKVVFTEGRLEVPTEPKAEMRLADGRSSAAAPILEWLLKHPLMGDMQEGFWEVNQSAPPPSTEELARLQSLAIDGDLEGLEEFIAAEQGGWARPAILEVAEGTAERVRARAAQVSEQLKQARADGEAAGKAPAK